MFKLIIDTVKQYLKTKRIYGQLIKAPFDTHYIYGLLELSGKDCTIEIIKPDTTRITIRKNKLQQAVSEKEYYKL